MTVTAQAGANTAPAAGPGITEPGIYQMTNEEYHADRGSLSSSGARMLLPPSCPALFRHAQDTPQEPKKTFELGSAAHKLVLGEGPDLIRVDADKWTTAAVKAEVAAIRDEGGIPLKPVEYQQVHDMADALRRHPVASMLFDPARGKPEQSLFWRDRPTGIMRRARFDWLPDSRSGRLIIPDYKTAADASDDAMQRDIAKYGYNQQADWYEEAARALGLGGQDAELLLIVQEKKAPFLINVIGIEFGSRIIGGAKNRAAINTFAECMSTGNWPGYGDEPNYLALPGYAENRDKEMYL